MYAIGSSARRGFGAAPRYDDEYSYDDRAGFGIVPVVAVTTGISLLSSLFGSHSGKTTAAERFVSAQNAGDQGTARAIIDQTFVHAYQQNIPDKADWLNVWQVILNEANPANRQYMNQKMGVTSGSTTGVPGSPNQPGATGYHVPTSQSDLMATVFSPVGIAAALALYFAFGRKR